MNQIYPAINSSTLVLYRRGARIAVLTGQIYFHNGCRLEIYEQLQSETGVVLIEQYGYEVWRGNEKLYWYDPQPHPHIPALAENHPHHKHVPPDIKHNRVPAPELAFERPNLSFLIEEIMALDI
ncbi:MAG: DUF6516 family protein [Chloroflexi bacterium]|nr:DUF6516 family protein [Chloroflexota bacterium]